MVHWCLYHKQSSWQMIFSCFIIMVTRCCHIFKVISYTMPTSKHLIITSPCYLWKMNCTNAVCGRNYMVRIYLYHLRVRFINFINAQFIILHKIHWDKIYKISVFGFAEISLQWEGSMALTIWLNIFPHGYHCVKLKF